MFSGVFKPVASQYIWLKVKGALATIAAAYQSVLTNITWTSSTAKSKFMTQLQNATETGSGDLSIRFNLDLVDEENSTKLGVGRITGKV